MAKLPDVQVAMLQRSCAALESHYIQHRSELLRHAQRGYNSRAGREPSIAGVETAVAGDDTSGDCPSTRTLPCCLSVSLIMMCCPVPYRGGWCSGVFEAATCAHAPERSCHLQVLSLSRTSVKRLAQLRLFLLEVVMAHSFTPNPLPCVGAATDEEDEVSAAGTGKESESEGADHDRDVEVLKGNAAQGRDTDAPGQVRCGHCSASSLLV